MHRSRPCPLLAQGNFHIMGYLSDLWGQILCEGVHSVDQGVGFGFRAESDLSQARPCTTPATTHCEAGNKVPKARTRAFLG
jgi:hypothetical protein